MTLLTEAETTVLIIDTAVVTVDENFTIHDPGWIFIRGDKILEIGGGPPPTEFKDQALEVIDGSGTATIPGMVNAHTHLFQTFFRGLADDKSLLDWLKECIWPGAIHLDAEIAKLAAKVGLIENLRTGVTSVIDHQYIHVDERIDDAVCEAADELGIRFLMARGWADRNYEPSLMETADEVIERSRKVHQKWNGHDNGRIRIELAPLIPWGCSDSAMISTTNESRSWGAGFHIHCAETKAEVEISQEERGVGHVEWLHGLGLLDKDAQLVHSVWLNDNELDLIAETQAVVVHCPVSNMYLASGVPRILEMMDRGIIIALGSDGPGSNNRQDMFEVLKSTVLMQKVHHLNPLALLPKDPIQMACNGGAKAFGKSNELGMIKPNYKADLTMVNLQTVFSAPVHNVVSTLVFCSTPADVQNVLVDGRLVLKDGEILGVDEKQLLAQAELAAKNLFNNAGVRTRVNQKNNGQHKT